MCSRGATYLLTIKRVGVEESEPHHHLIDN